MQDISARLGFLSRRFVRFASTVLEVRCPSISRSFDFGLGFFIRDYRLVPGNDGSSNWTKDQYKSPI
jgi:hypothetical protein